MENEVHKVGDLWGLAKLLRGMTPEARRSVVPFPVKLRGDVVGAVENLGFHTDHLRVRIDHPYKEGGYIREILLGGDSEGTASEFGMWSVGEEDPVLWGRAEVDELESFEFDISSSKARVIPNEDALHDFNDEYGCLTASNPIIRGIKGNSLWWNPTLARGEVFYAVEINGAGTGYPYSISKDEVPDDAKPLFKHHIVQDEDGIFALFKNIVPQSMGTDLITYFDAVDALGRRCLVYRTLTGTREKFYTQVEQSFTGKIGMLASVSFEPEDSKREPLPQGSGVVYPLTVKEVLA